MQVNSWGGAWEWGYKFWDVNMRTLGAPLGHLWWYTVVSRKYNPPLATLALVLNAGGGGGLIRGMQHFLLWLCHLFRCHIIEPSMNSLSAGDEGRAQGGEMLLTLTVGWRASALKNEEVGRFCEIAGVSIIDADHRHFNGRQLSSLNKLNLNFLTAGWICIWGVAVVPPVTTYGQLLKKRKVYIYKNSSVQLTAPCLLLSFQSLLPANKML